MITPRIPATAAELALMQGAPPPPSQHVTLANWQEGPYNRWSFQHVSELVPSAVIARGDGPVLELPEEPVDLGGWQAFLDATYTDGFLVVQDGRIRYERYFNGMTRSTLHLLQSVSKSMCGMVVGRLVERGVVALDERVQTYVPELWDSAFGGARVADLLDMTASVKFNEEYADPASEVQAQDRSGGWRPRRPHDPENSYDFLRSLRADGEHGRVFQYCSASTDALAWVLERAGGRRYPELVSEELWSRVGAERDASITVDSAGFAFANGGVSVTLRDLARFGLYALSSPWLARLRRLDPAVMAGTPFSVSYPEGSYSTCWWCTGDEHGTFYGTGIYGQFLWIVPALSLVIAKVSTLPRALDLDVVAAHHRAFRALTDRLA